MAHNITQKPPSDDDGEDRAKPKHTFRLTPDVCLNN